MSSIWDHWAVQYRNWRVKLMLVMMIGFGIWAIYQKIRLDNDPLLRIEHFNGTVEKIIRSTSSSGGQTVFGDISLPDGRKVRLYMPQPYPNQGDSLPLSVEVYESGENFYAVDVDRWIMGGAY